MTHHFKIKTWSCNTPQCTYHQDFDPEDIVKSKKIFPLVPPGKCPACWMKQSHATNHDDPIRIISELVLETNADKKIKCNIISPEEIDLLDDDDLVRRGHTRSSLKLLAISELKKAKLLEDLG
jgi:hypothetical protein